MVILVSFVFAGVSSWGSNGFEVLQSGLEPILQ